MKKQIDLSLVICVADDLRIIKLLKTVDIDCEVIIVLNGATKQLKQKVIEFGKSSTLRMKLLEIPERNLSKARNYGIENAMYDKVVFYDSDCLIIKDSLIKFYYMLDNYLLVDGKVFFKQDTYASKVISFTREMGIPGYALCPAIGVNKKIKPMVCNYFFDNDIQWIEDSELNIRAKKANIKVGEIKSVTCIHDNLSFKQDLKSAYRYGYGVKKAADKNLHKKRPTANWNLIIPIFRKNKISGLYYIVWNVIYCIGYFINKPI